MPSNASAPTPVPVARPTDARLAAATAVIRPGRSAMKAVLGSVCILIGTLGCSYEPSTDAGKAEG